MMLRPSPLIVTIALLAVAGTSTASQPPPADKPPLLSTVPSPPAGATPVPADMSGQPLQVGDLPPGVLMVRVIRRSFAENLSGERVRIQVGPEARSFESTTDRSGRARFDGLRIGDHVRVSASIDGEVLGSGTFVLPADGGVRMLLVSGVGAGIPADAESVAPAESLPPVHTARQFNATGSIVALDAASVAITLFAMTGLAILWSLRPRSASRRSAGGASDSR